VEALEATTLAGAVVAHTSAATVSASLVAKPANGVRRGWTLPQTTVRPAIPDVALTTPELTRIPGLVVDIACILSKQSLWQAQAHAVAVIPTLRSLACMTIERFIAVALASRVIADSTIAAFGPGMSIVVVNELRAAPREAIGAGTARTVYTRPFGVTI
jgi:hypothetical protein